MDMLINSGFSAGTGTVIKIDPIKFAKLCPSVGDPNLLVDFTNDMLLGIGLAQTTKDAIKTGTLLSGQSSDYYWTNAWSNYVSNPNTSNTNIVKSRLTSMLIEMTRLSEYHLC
jgi:hypothetical protein